MHYLLILSLILAAGPVTAGQTVHKCPGPDGKSVYQQNACNDASGTELNIETGRPSQSRLATQEEIDQCLKLIKIRYNYKDPDSLRVEGSSVVAIYPSGRKEVILSVNGKNSYGAYVGAKPAVCKYKASGDLDDLAAF